MSGQQDVSRRTFVKGSAAVVGGLALGGMPLGAQAKEKIARVYFCRTITPQSLIAMYEALKHPLKPKVAVKISTGEPGGHNFLQPALIAPLVKKLNGTIVECCTAYKGRRVDPKEHWKAIEEHGFKAIAPCDIMDEFGDMAIPVKNGFHLKENIVGKHLANYASILMLSHFKGHAMGGFGGALKNMSIGIGSTRGKTNIHTAGVTTDYTKLFSNLPKQNYFLESMADACKAVMDTRAAKTSSISTLPTGSPLTATATQAPRNPRWQTSASLPPRIPWLWTRPATTLW